MKKQIGRFLAAGMVLALAGCMVTTAAFAQEELSEAVSEQPGAQMSEPGREKFPVKKHLSKSLTHSLTPIVHANRTEIDSFSVHLWQEDSLMGIALRFT